MELQSEKTAELVTALTKASGQIKVARKDSENPFFHSRYADLSAITEASREALVNNDLVVTQSTSIELNQMVLVTTLHHVSGQWIRGYYPITAVKADPQSMGSAVTYARRYALSSMLGIVTEDDDGESSMGRNAQPTQQINRVEKSEGGKEYYSVLTAEEPRAVPADWKQAIIHFGKSKGKSLGSLTSNSLRWWVKEWQPQPFKGKLNAIAIALRVELDKAQIELGLAEDKVQELA